MKKSVTFTFTGLFIAVAIGYIFFGAPIPKQEAPVVEGDSKLLPFDSEKPIKLIQIQRPEQKETITLENGESGWQLKYPKVYRADKMMAEGLVTALKVSTKARRLLREKDWEEYGLAKPGLKIGIETEGSAKREYLLLGDQSPVSEMVYARWEGEKEYFLLDARFKMAFDRSVYSLREKRIIRLPAQKIDKIRVQSFKETYELSKKDGKWYWTEPVSLIGRKITEQESYQLLTIMRDLHIKEFLDTIPVDEVSQEFSRSTPYIQVWEKENTSTVRFGKELIAQDAYYAMIEEEKVLLLMAKDNLLGFLKIFDGVEPEIPAEPSPRPSGAFAEAIDLKAIKETETDPAAFPAVSPSPA